MSGSSSSGNTPNTSIPEGYDLRKIVERMLLKLWLSNALNNAAIQEIMDAGRK
jgi:hypothetical protein